MHVMHVLHVLHAFGNPFATLILDLNFPEPRPLLRRLTRQAELAAHIGAHHAYHPCMMKHVHSGATPT